MTANTDEELEVRRARFRARSAMGNCRKCGYAAINVIHETDRHNAPEGLAYYADIPFCEFEPDGRTVLTPYHRGSPERTDYTRGYQAGYRAGRRHCDPDFS